MQIQVIVDGQTVLDAALDLDKLLGHGSGDSIVAQIVAGRTVPKSTPISKEQAQELLSRLDPKTVTFLKQLAINGGKMTWSQMRTLFKIPQQGDTKAFTAHYGKGLTRSLRNITGDPSANLIFWDDDEWVDENKFDALYVYCDGPALAALQAIVAG